MRKVLHVLLALLLVSSLFATSAFADGESEEKLSLVALGDSITFGYVPGMIDTSDIDMGGRQLHEITWTEFSGWIEQGLIPPASNWAFPFLIGDEQNQFEVTNLSVPGWRTTSLLNELENNPEYANTVYNADLITLNIGNNDLLAATNFSELIKDFDPSILPTLLPIVEEATEEIINNIEAILSHTKSETPIILYNIYNPTAKEEVGELIHPAIDGMLQSVNEKIQDAFINNENVYIVDAFSAFAGKQEEYLYYMEDKNSYDIHPNETGQRALAQIANERLPEIFSPQLQLQFDYNTELTPEFITIYVTTNLELEQLKWLPGERSINDFENDGNDILDTHEFDVYENGIYSVYAKSTDGQEKIETIEINNIVPKLEVTLEPSTTEENVDSVTITLSATSGIWAAYWFKGEASLEDFDEDKWTKIEGDSFTVTENGVYSVYILSLDGQETVEHITISNIVEETEDPKDPQPDPKPTPAPSDEDGTDDEDEDKDDNGTTKDDDDDGTTPTGDKKKASSEKLPKTATNNFNKLLVGIVSTLTGFIILLFARRRKAEAIT